MRIRCGAHVGSIAHHRETPTNWLDPSETISPHRDVVVLSTKAGDGKRPHQEFAGALDGLCCRQLFDAERFLHSELAEEQRSGWRVADYDLQ
eukprot:scaffold107624_cov37-Prasinocladus_malaysianus.AAC.2